MVDTETYTDVVELCAILECLGFGVKSLDIRSDGNTSQDEGIRTVVIDCQSSGLHVVLEKTNSLCTCPPPNEQNSGFWQVSGVAGGKQLNKETGSKLLGSFPKAYRERLSKELQEMIRSIRVHNESDIASPAVNRSASLLELGNKSGSLMDISKGGINKSASMIELATPEKRLQQLKVVTPNHYRSLDTLTADKGSLAQPRPLQQLGGDKKNSFQALAHRQSTYTVCSTPGGSVRGRNKTSSPIQSVTTNVLDTLIAAEKAAEELRNKIAFVIKEFMNEENDESSMSSMLDVSKISLLKGPEISKAQFASSPNLSGLVARDDLSKSKLKRFESVSTSNLAPKGKADKPSKIPRRSPNFLKKEPSGIGDKALDGKNRLQSLFKAKFATPVRSPKAKVEGSPNLSSTKKKYSHVKSTIPRPTPRKE